MSGEPIEGGQGGIDLEQARAWIGARVEDVGGAGVGRAEAVLVDRDDGAPTWLVIRLGRFRRRTAVPVELVAAAADRVWVPVSGEAIRAAPGVERGAGLTAALERLLASHYEVPDAAGRPAALAGRSGEEIGSGPA